MILMTKGRARSQGSPGGTYSEKSGTRTGFSPDTVFSRQVFFRHNHSLTTNAM